MSNLGFNIIIIIHQCNFYIICLENIRYWPTSHSYLLSINSRIRHDHRLVVFVEGEAGYVADETGMGAMGEGERLGQGVQPFLANGARLVLHLAAAVALSKIVVKEIFIFDPANITRFSTLRLSRIDFKSQNAVERIWRF